MNSELQVTHTKTFDCKPLAVVDGLPGGSAELTTMQLRVLAAALTQAAADCESASRGARVRRHAQVYSLAPDGGAA